MATAAPHVKVLRQLASAKDDYLSGALDLTWDGGKATVFVVFGQPSHAVLETDVRRLEGAPAIDAILDELPNSFTVGPWRRAMSPQETLTLSIDELAGPFAALAGSLPEPEPEEGTEAWWGAEDDSPALGFGLEDFPLLPEGPALWAPSAAIEVPLEDRLAGLPAALMVLNGPRLRAAGVVSGGEWIDAVWVDEHDHACGETAAMALVGAREGTLAAYRLELPGLAEVIPALWRFPEIASGVELSWIDAAAFITSMQGQRSDVAVVVDAPVRGVALFARGRLAGVYSESSRAPSQSADDLRQLLNQATGLLRVLARGRPAFPSARPDRQSLPPPDAPPPPPPTPPEIAADSAYVDFNEVKRELVQISMVWLGDHDNAPVTELINRTRPTIDDFVAAIDSIRSLRVAGHEQNVVQSMAREMHHHAAERLCGA